MKAKANSNRNTRWRLTTRQTLLLAAMGAFNLLLIGGAGWLFLEGGSALPIAPAPPNHPGSTNVAMVQPETTLLPSTTPAQPGSHAPLPTLTWPPAMGEPLLPSLTPTFLPPQPTPTPGQRYLIGHSVEGRELVVERFGSGPNERMLIAGIHGGNEYNTVLLAQALLDHLNAHPEAIPAGVTLYILPNLNPDGYARSWDIYGRANANNVDLNHNFPIDWQADWSREGCWRYLRLNGGEGPASEPETAALMDFLRPRHVQALISYHSAALGIFPGGEPPDPASAALAAALARVSDYPYPPIDTGCEMTGSLADWAVSRGIAAVDLELTDHLHIDFAQNLRILERLLTWEKP